eukprot:358113-Chlamydomonas_euryale.AAC.3
MLERSTFRVEPLVGPGCASPSRASPGWVSREEAALAPQPPPPPTGFDHSTACPALRHTSSLLAAPVYIYADVAPHQPHQPGYVAWLMRRQGHIL